MWIKEHFLWKNILYEFNVWFFFSYSIQIKITQWRTKKYFPHIITIKTICYVSKMSHFRKCYFRITIQTYIFFSLLIYSFRFSNCFHGCGRYGFWMQHKFRIWSPSKDNQIITRILSKREKKTNKFHQSWSEIHCYIIQWNRYYSNSWLFENVGLTVTDT